MNRNVRRVVGLRCFAVGIALVTSSVAFGCGGDDSSAGTSADGGGSDEASGDSAAGGDGASDVDGGTTGDGGGLDGGGDGAPAGPGFVQCGSAACDTASSFCCRTGLDPSLQACVATNGSCRGSLWRCEKPSDCTGADHCVVGGKTAQGGLSTACAPSKQLVVCATSADCGDAGACVSQTCHFEGGVQTIQTCGALAANVCPP